MLGALFEKRDIQLILQIPLGRGQEKDSWSWYHEKRGASTVKSGYRMLRNAESTVVITWQEWTGRGCGIPGKVKCFTICCRSDQGGAGWDFEKKKKKNSRRVLEKELRPCLKFMTRMGSSKNY